jgi:hypothetical protein
MPAPSYSPPAGNAVNLNFAGAYAAPAGNNVILNFVNVGAYTLTVDPGSYAVSGSSVGLKVGRRLRAYDQLIPGMIAGGFNVLSWTGWTTGAGLALNVDSTTRTLDVTDTSGGSDTSTRAIAVIPGRTYTLEGYLVLVTTSMGMKVGTTAGGQQLGTVLSTANGIVFTSNPSTNPAKSLTFVAPASGVVYVSIFTGSSGQGRVRYLRMEESGTYLFAGTDVTITKTGRILSATPGAYAFTGTPVTLRVGRKITADPGVYTQTRTDVRLLVGRRLEVTPGVYTLSVTTADITYIIGYYLHVEKGSYALTGSPVGLLVGRRIAVTPGSYVFTGSAVNWVYARCIKAAPGSYVMTGSDVALRVGYRLAVTPGAYALTGSDVDLINRRLIVDPGSYALQGSAVGLIIGRRLVVDPGSYVVSGSNVLLLAGRRLKVAPGAYQLTGTDVRLLAGRLVRVTPGAYVFSGTDPRLRRGYTVHAQPGSYALTWTAARVVATRKMMVEPGAYHLSFVDTQLTPHWRPRGPRAIAVGFAASRRLSVEPQNRRVAVEPQDRRCSVEPAARRYAAVEPRDKELLGGSMLKWPEKDPNEVLDYELDWADPDEPRLEVGETLLTSVWSVVEGDVVINTDPAYTKFTAQGLSTVCLSGGTPGTKCVLLNRVTTSHLPRSYDKEVSLRVRDH